MLITMEKQALRTGQLANLADGQLPLSNNSLEELFCVATTLTSVSFDDVP